MWSQTMLYGAHPTNPNFLTKSTRSARSNAESFFADKVEAEAEVNRSPRAREGHHRHHPANRAHRRPHREKLRLALSRRAGSCPP